MSLSDFNHKEHITKKVGESVETILWAEHWQLALQTAESDLLFTIRFIQTSDL